MNTLVQGLTLRFLLEGQGYEVWLSTPFDAIDETQIPPSKMTRSVSADYRGENLTSEQCFKCKNDFVFICLVTFHEGYIIFKNYLWWTLRCLYL